MTHPQQVIETTSFTSDAGLGVEGYYAHVDYTIDFIKQSAIDLLYLQELKRL